MLSIPGLALILPTLTPQTRQGHGYRIVDYQYFAAHPNLHPMRILYGFGAPIHGQRFTPRGGMATIYFAEDFATAFDEVHRNRRSFASMIPALPCRFHPAALRPFSTTLKLCWMSPTLPFNRL